MIANDKTVSVHPTAIIGATAKIDSTATVGPYAIIEDGAVVGKGCVIAAHAIIRSGAILGDNVRVDSFAVVAGDPQDIHFDPKTVSFVKVGDGTVLREGVTLHRSTQPEGVTVIGKNCFLMAQAHVAHDCTLGDNVIMANASMCGGHVQLGNNVFVGGGAAFHQFVRVGEGAMIGGLAAISHDTPPYVTAAERNCACGLNLVGLKRRGATSEVIRELKNLYKAILLPGGNPVENAKAQKSTTPHGQTFLAFFTESKRHFIHSQSNDVE